MAVKQSSLQTVENQRRTSRIMTKLKELTSPIRMAKSSIGTGSSRPQASANFATEAVAESDHWKEWTRLENSRDPVDKS